VLTGAIKSAELYPVILKVPDYVKKLKGRKKLFVLSFFARKALICSADFYKIKLKPIQKDENGAPLPQNGVFFSLSHKSKYVAGVCSFSKVGIDVENMKKRSRAILDYAVGDSEWEQALEKNWKMFYRIFTSKESVLKANGKGIAYLKKCKLIKVPDNDTMVMEFAGKLWTTKQIYFDNHICSLASELESYTLNWKFKN